MSNYEIAVLAGDGIGPEIMAEAKKVEDAFKSIYCFYRRSISYIDELA